MTATLATELHDRLADQRDRAARARAAQQDSERSHGRSLLSAALVLEDELRNTEARLHFGFSELDDMLRGIGPSELCYLTGKAHSGKTQLMLHMVWHNAGHRFLYFALDESPSHILRKLVAITHGVDASTLDTEIEAGNRASIDLVRHTAEDLFPNLEIVDEGLTATQMSTVLEEAQDRWGEPCHGVFLDYLDLLPGPTDYSGTKAKSIKLKAWARTHNVPVIAIHQPRRGGAGRGQQIGMDDMANCGETEAMFVLGVFRKRDDRSRSFEERTQHTDTLTVNVDKNKRTNRTAMLDYHLHPQTGRIRNLRPIDLVPEQKAPLHVVR